MRPLQDILFELCPRRVLGVRMRIASRSSAAAGMHASMLSLFAVELHKVMQHAQQLQLRRLRAITCVHVLCSLRSGNATASTLRAFHRRLCMPATWNPGEQKTAAQTDPRANGLRPLRQRHRVPECAGMSRRELSRSLSAMMEDYSCANHDSIVSRMARRAMRAAFWHTHT